jgi:Leucine-rich repeat (LRR) protein
MQNSDINKNIIDHMQNDLQKQNRILEKFNEEFETELKIDTKVVYLNWKNIDGKALSTLCQIDFNKMIEFQSCGTFIEDISYFKNAKFPQLKELYLTDNNISDISILEDVDFENLTIIYLNKNKIKDINVFGKVKFYNLNKLFLDGNSIYDISVFKNIPLSNLENINLSRNIITDISPLKVIKLKKLQLLNIKKNGIDYSLKENSDIIHDLRDKSIRIVY